jgi:hypothetical protein
MDGVVKDEPVKREAPPVDAAYQFTVPVQPEVDKTTVPVPHLEALTAVMLLVVTVTVTGAVAAQAAGAPVCCTDTV